MMVRNRDFIFLRRGTFMRTGLWRIVAAVLFALVTISSSKLSAQSGPGSNSGIATPQPGATSAAPANSSGEASTGAGTAPADAGQIKQVGGGVKAPVVIKQPEPEFSEEARHKPMNATVTVSLIVDQRGMPQNVHVTRGVGMGLDENAVKAVKQYRFKPAMENGKPVAVYLNVMVHFIIADSNGKVPPENTIQP
jgi:TonB family protein